MLVELDVVEVDDEMLVELDDEELLEVKDEDEVLDVEVGADDENEVDEDEEVLELDGTEAEDVLVLTEADKEAVLELVEEDNVEEAIEDDEEEEATMYIFKALRPPQYSNEFAMHTMLQPVASGVVPGIKPEPALMVLPQ